MEDIGRYRIRGELGSGGMGVVYRAYDPVLGREVAIKTLKLSNFSEPSERDALRDRLAREARAAAALSHSGIVAIHDVVQQRDPQQGDLLCLVMERIEGQTLAHVLSTSFLDMPSALRIIRETAAALDYAHRKGIVHRDIKPANLMLDETGTVKVADFGIAKITSSQTRTESASGMIVGTAGYMAPEQLRGAPVDGHTDQFSLAVVAFEILARRRPFMADSIVALTHQVVFESPPTLSTLRPGFGPAVDAVFDKALSKSPAARYPTCSDFAADLEAKINSAVSQPTLAYPPIPPPPPKKSSPQLWWWAAAIFAILSIGGAAATYALRRKAEEPPPVAVKQVPTPQPVTVAKTPPVDPVPSPTPAPPTPTPAPTTAITIARQGEIRANPKDGQKYIFIMPGTFTMGCIPNDPICGGFAKPAHRVAIGKPFWMAQTPVTVAAYRAFAQATHREMPKTPKFNPNWSLTDHPIVNVNWDDAVAYAKWAGGRLPTEAEWEYAARGGAVDTLFPWGNDASHDLANFGQGTAGSDEQGAVEGKDVWLYTSPVASFPPNRLNLYDMAGNVSQWCADWFGPSYYGAAHEKDPRGPETGTLRVNRGGSWKSPARFLHTSFRGTRPPDERGLTTGIRCVLESIYVPQH